jgi:hypothetical protein
VTAFLHFLAQRDHQAETPDERRDKRPPTPEDDAPPPSTPSRAEILGTYNSFSFPSGKEGLRLLIITSFHFCTGFASRRHRRCFTCLFIGKEEIPVVIHGGIVKYRDYPLLCYMSPIRTIDSRKKAQIS